MGIQAHTHMRLTQTRVYMGYRVPTLRLEHPDFASAGYWDCYRVFSVGDVCLGATEFELVPTYVAH